MARNALTIILLTRNELVRADFRRGRREPSGLWRQPRPDLPDLVSIVETALLQTPGVGRCVWLLSTDVWTQTLAVPRIKMAGLSPEQQAGALNFEAEGLSGHPAGESAVSFVRLPAEGQELGYWLMQTPAAPLVQIDEAVVRAGGGRLAGVAHPGGLPTPLQRQGSGSWERVELWPDAVVLLEARDRGAPRIEIINMDPQGGRWQARVDQTRAARGRAEHVEMLASADVRAPESAEGEPVVRLSDDGDLRRWLARWVVVLSGKTVRVPHVAPRRRPLSAARRLTLGILAAGVAAVFCAAHYFLWLQPTYNTAGNELIAAKKPAAVMADLQKQSKDLDAKIKQSSQQLKQVQRDLEAFGVQKQRYARLLDILSRQKPGDLIIEKIDGEAGEVTLHGACLRAELADQLAEALQNESSSMHWTVLPCHKQAMGLQAGGGPWKFDLAFKEQAPEPVQSAAPSAAKPR